MKKIAFKTFLLIVSLGITLPVIAQEQPLPKPKTNNFWNHVQFGGGVGLAIGNDFTDITIAPSAIYNFNDYFALGTGLQYSYLKQKNYYSSNVVGGSLIALVNPIEEIQLSLELEEVNVNTTYESLIGDAKRSFWNTGLYLGGGYRVENVT
ncbi:MAG: hypothetical protein KAX93_07745, partial [Flavobacterium sp.]|nr:hypothetical protein [Flavobacterium sp.]